MPQKPIDQFHKTLPKVASKVSLTALSGAIMTHSLAIGAPLFVLGGTKIAHQTLLSHRLGKKLLQNKLGKKVHRLGKKADEAIIDIADNWIGINNWLIDNALPTKQWHITLPDDLKDGQAKQKKYLLICNHQSWVDTSVVQYVSQDILPLTRFFAKHELIYIPVVGQAFYLLDFPMMKRHSKEAIAKNPSLAGKDLLEARRACELLTDKPFVLLNYLEGTRFTTQKHTKQNSPYTHLLKPKAGGFALAISSLGDEIDGILDMTIVYPDGSPDYGDLWAGKVKRLGVDIRHIQMDDELFCELKAGNYQTDPATKHRLHAWLDEIWQQKDKKIASILADFDRDCV